MQKLKIGISIGDINGIGPEVVIKTFSNEKLLKYCTPVIYSSSKVMAYHKNMVNPNFQFYSTNSVDNIRADRVNVVNVWDAPVEITLGKVTKEGGKFAFESLESAVKDLRDKKIDALVTAPIHKKSMELAGFKHVGHTMYLEEMLPGRSLMMLVSDELRVGLVTDHEPVKDVASKISKARIQGKLKIMEKTLRMDFGIERPLIAVLGLNPHAGDEGLIGKEDDTVVRPAVVELKKQGFMVNGPFPADGFFGSGDYRKYDGILAMYHDQGLVPFKLLSFGKGVNFTAGLGAIRTSPDHGTAFDIAGKGEGDPSSFRTALFAAIDIARSRHAFYTDSENSILKKNKAKFKEYDEKEDEVLPEDAPVAE